MDAATVILALVALAAIGGVIWLATRGRGGDAFEQLRGAFRSEIELLRASGDLQAKALRDEVAAKLETVRQTVDEKLHGALETKLNAAFNQVNEQLTRVNQGLGEMRKLESGVDGLARMLTNVKTRGAWGEAQLANLLEQTLASDQYQANFAPRPDSRDRVEFAVRFPGDGATPVWLPIDAKFPQEDYERLLDAAERADREGVETAAKALEARVRQFAKDVAAKYIAPPLTTEFAILFVPTEGLYAELQKRPGLADSLQRELGVMLCGPATLNAVLVSLRVGFRQIALQERAGEVQRLLAAVKTEFGKFGESLDKVKKKLDEAAKSVEDAGVRKRAMERQLRNVETLPPGEARQVLDLPPGERGDGGGADGE